MTRSNAKNVTHVQTTKNAEKIIKPTTKQVKHRRSMLRYRKIYPYNQTTATKNSSIKETKKTRRRYTKAKMMEK